MKITINIPLNAAIINGGFEIKIAKEGESWKKEQLGDYADRSGVYIHHSQGKILYIGTTTKGDWGTFGERLRREFQFSSSQKSKLYQLLALQKSPTKTFFLDLNDIEIMVDSGPMKLEAARKAMIMEQTLIGVFQPEGNNQ